MTPTGSNATEGRRPTAVTLVVVAGAVLAVLYLLRQDPAAPFVVAGIVAYVCTPLIDLLARRAHGHRWLFVLLVLLALAVFAGLLGWLGLPTAAEQLLAMAAKPRDVIDGFVRVLMGNHSFNIGGASLNSAQIAARAADGLSSVVTNGSKMLEAGVVGFTAMFELIITWVILGYLLFDAPRISQGLLVASAILAFIGYAIALRLSIDQFFGPLVLGKAARVRPVLVIFCFLAGGLVLGISGVILAVPIALGIKVALAMHNERFAPDLVGGPA